MIKFCSLVSGSSGNAVFASDGKTNLLIDCGLTGKRTVQALCEIGADAAQIDAILITHEHSDHISGAGVLSRKYSIPIYANGETWAAMEGRLGRIDAVNKKVFEPLRAFEIGSIGINAFPTPHDAAAPVGYNLFAQGRKLSVATDMGHVSEDVLAHICGSDVVILESNHDVKMLKNGKYPYYLKKRILSDVGHLSNEDAGIIAVRLAKSGAAAILLGHLSAENNLPALAYRVVVGALAGAGVKVGADIRLGVAQRFCVSAAYLA